MEESTAKWKYPLLAICRGSFRKEEHRQPAAKGLGHGRIYLFVRLGPAPFYICPLHIDGARLSSNPADQGPMSHFALGHHDEWPGGGADQNIKIAQVIGNNGQAALSRHGNRPVDGAAYGQRAHDATTPAMDPNRTGRSGTESKEELARLAIYIGRR